MTYLVNGTLLFAGEGSDMDALSNEHARSGIHIEYVIVNGSVVLRNGKNSSPVLCTGLYAF